MSSSAKRALRVLETIGAADRPLGVTEIARQLSLPPGTVFRSLDALARSGLVARYQSSSRFVVGEASERLRRTIIAQFPMREACLPYLRQLASLSAETVTLHVRIGWYAVRIASLPGAGEISNAPPVGECCPLGGNFCGRAILALLAPKDIAAYRAWAEKNELELPSAARLKTARERGFDLGDSTPSDSRAPIAFPVRVNEAAIAAVAIEGPVVARDQRASHESRWRAIIAEIENVARKNPALFVSPFAHLDPNLIAL
jgi:IclR family acetate operon transcriptional repressor